MCSVAFMGDSGPNPSAVLLCGRKPCALGTAGLLLLPVPPAPPLGRLGWAWLPFQQNIPVLSGCSPPVALQLRLGGIEILVSFHGFLVTTACGGFLHHPLGLEGPFQRLGVRSLSSAYSCHNPWKSPSWHGSKAFPLACWTTGCYLVETGRCETRKKGLKPSWADLVAQSQLSLWLQLWRRVAAGVWVCDFQVVVYVVAPLNLAVRFLLK